MNENGIEGSDDLQGIFSLIFLIMLIIIFVLSDKAHKLRLQLRSKERREEKVLCYDEYGETGGYYNEERTPAQIKYDEYLYTISQFTNRTAALISGISQISTGAASRLAISAIRRFEIAQKRANWWEGMNVQEFERAMHAFLKEEQKEREDINGRK